MNLQLFRKMKTFLGITILMFLLVPISKSLAVDNKIFTDDDLKSYKYGNGETESNMTEKNITRNTKKDKNSYDSNFSGSMPAEALPPTIQQEHPATREEEIAEIKQVWASFVKRLATRDIEGALEYVVDWRKEGYRVAFYMKKDEIAQEMSKKDEVRLKEVNDHMATGENVVEGYSYPVTFIKNKDGRWKIESF
jgi:hypothetical protein